MADKQTSVFAFILGSQLPNTAYIPVIDPTETDPNNRNKRILVSELKAYVNATSGGVTQLTTPSVTVDQITSSGFRLNWSAITGANQYIVTIRTGSQSGTVVGSSTTSGLNYSYVGNPSTTYYYSVVAHDTTAAATDSNPAAGSQATSAGSTTLATPSVSGQVFSTTWIQLQIASAIPNATSYLKQISLQSDFSTILAFDNSAGLTTNFTGLTPGTLYYLRAKASANGFTDSAFGTGQATTTGTTTYNTTLTFASSTTASHGTLEAIVAATNNTIKFEFNTKTDTGTPCRMDIYVGGTQQMAVNFQDTYLGAAFRFTDLAGTTHTGTFTNGTVNF